MSLPKLPSIADLENLSDHDFSSTVKILFEPAPPLERRLLPARPFSSYQQLIDFAHQQIATLSLDEKYEVLRGHPAIGQKNVSGISKVEQGQEEDPIVLARLAELNNAYVDYFGFPFVIFVNRRPKSVICGILEEIMNKKELVTAESELDRALNDLFAIARDRLKNYGTQ